MNDRMNDNDDEGRDPAPASLAAPLAALRSAMATQDAPRGVEKELMAAFAQTFPRKRWYDALSPRQWGMAGGLTSTALVAVIALSLNMQAPHTPGPLHMIAADDGPAFIALESLERIEQEPDAQMVEADVPRTALASYGVSVNPENAGDVVRAEMLVGADGSPLALRLVAMH
jgi:hypothetical protein